MKRGLMNRVAIIASLSGLALAACTTPEPTIPERCLERQEAGLSKSGTPILTEPVIAGDCLPVARVLPAAVAPVVADDDDNDTATPAGTPTPPQPPVTPTPETPTPVGDPAPVTPETTAATAGNDGAEAVAAQGGTAEAPAEIARASVGQGRPQASASQGGETTGNVTLQGGNAQLGAGQP